MTTLLTKDHSFRQDTLHWTGLLSIVVSTIFFCINNYLSGTSSDFSSFIICYGITAIYSLAVLMRTVAHHGWYYSRSPLHHTAIMLILWFISAFALNREMNIFDNSADWLSVTICIASASVILATFREHLPDYLRQLLIFLLSISACLFAYYAAYLVPFYLMGAVASIFIGISLHVFIPMLLCITSITYIVRMSRNTPYTRYITLAGICIPILIIALFTFQWRKLQQSVKQVQNNYTLKENKLPEWVAIAQQLPESFVTEKFLKTGLVYYVPELSGDWYWGNIGGATFDEPKKHDPLVVIASLFSGKADISDEDRVSILRSVYNSRHLAQERLWSGDHLETSNVVSNVRIFPEYRMAYTEKTLSIENHSQSRWDRDEEAIYTFHLPEGSVATALSLWIDGIEEKSRLTTKGKADSAFKTIVGVESRDPSVLHWQEGNTITVRVFPCNRAEKRKFRIGITSPLVAKDGKLKYENPWFEGPSPRNASELVKLTFSTAPKALETNLNLEDDGSYGSERNYQDRWDVHFSETTLSDKRFSFAGHTYQLKKSERSAAAFQPNRIYMDINSSWSQSEFDALWPEISRKEVYVFNEQLIRLTDKNKDQQFQQLIRRNFSLFPLYTIADPEHALLISKSTETSPDFSDLEGSIFQKRTSAYLAQSKPIRLYHIGDTLSPYLKTLKEFRTFNYMQGSCAGLVKQLQTGRWIESPETDEILNIPGSGFSITKIPDSTAATAPDHLLRLFAYNNILKKVGPTYFEKNYVQDEMLAIADQAFIASPVSSLIVLESKKDYDRFGIEESKNSLKNASMNSSGAAPEPAEWLLIIIVVAVAGYYLYPSAYWNKRKPKWNY